MHTTYLQTAMSGEETSAEGGPGEYRLKAIKFDARDVHIVCQNEGGPCPLLAICNVLLLKGDLTLEWTSHVTETQLTQMLATYLIERSPPVGTTEAYEQQLSSVIDMLPCLRRGLDVNVRFKSPESFEFTPELGVFDLAGVTLLHGWLLDPQDTVTSAVVSSKSYNQLVEKLVEYKAAQHTLEQACAVKIPTVDELFGKEEHIGTNTSEEKYCNIEKHVGEVLNECVDAAVMKSETENDVLEEVENDPGTKNVPGTAEREDSGSSSTSSEYVLVEGSNSVNVPSNQEESKETIDSISGGELSVNVDVCIPSPSMGESKNIVKSSNSEENIVDSWGESKQHMNDLPDTPAVEPSEHNLYEEKQTTSDECKNESKDILSIDVHKEEETKHSDERINSSTESINSVRHIRQGSLRPEEKEKLSAACLEGMVIEHFLNDTASQLTYYGLQCLVETVPEGALSAFFRNNHFAALHKRKGALYLLVTDCGYARSSDIVWERLDVIDGDTEMVGSNFVPYRSPARSPSHQAPPPPYSQSEDPEDLMLQQALAISRAEAEGVTDTIYTDTAHTPAQVMTDEDYARVLHAEELARVEAQENARARRAQQQNNNAYTRDTYAHTDTSTSRGGRRRSSGSNSGTGSSCIIC